MIKIDPVKQVIVASEYRKLLKKFIEGKYYNPVNHRNTKLDDAVQKNPAMRTQLLFVKEGIVDNDFVALGKPKDIKKKFKEICGSFPEGFVQKMDYYFSNFIGTKIGHIIPDHRYASLQVNTWLSKALGINCCPYCNRDYTLSRKLRNGRETHPEFDHFYPKSKYPYLALSFYNLVPSCHSCNHLKLDNEMDINPHFMSFENLNAHFVLSDRKGKRYNPAVDHWVFDSKQIRVRVVNSCKNVKVLGLDERYNLHSDYITDIISKAQAYNASYYEGLIESYKSLGKTQEEIYRFIWGGYQNPNDYGKRPLSKFTKDILKELGID